VSFFKFAVAVVGHCNIMTSIIIFVLLLATNKLFFPVIKFLMIKKIKHLQRKRNKAVKMCVNVSNFISFSFPLRAIFCQTHIYDLYIYVYLCVVAFLVIILI